MFKQIKKFPFITWNYTFDNKNSILTTDNRAEKSNNTTKLQGH